MTPARGQQVAITSEAIPSPTNKVVPELCHFGAGNVIGEGECKDSPDSNEKPHLNRETMMARNEDSLPEICAGVNQPTNLQELFANVKFSLDRNLLIRVDFYTKENLQRFFGGPVEITDYSAETGSIYTVAKVEKLTGILLNPAGYRGDDITICLRPDEKDKTKLHANMNIPGASLDPRINVDFVRSLFEHGNEMIISDANDLISKEAIAERMRNAPKNGPPPHFPPYCRATHPMGCKVIEFKCALAANTTTSLGFVTAAGSEIKNIIINQVER